MKSFKLNKNDISLKDIEDIISNIKLNVTSWKTLENCDPNKITKLSAAWYTIDAIPNLKKFDKLEEINLEYCTISQKDSIRNINDTENLKRLTLSNCNLEEIPIDFSNLKSIQQINLSGNYITSKELSKLETLKDIKNLNIELRGNSIIDANSLLKLDSSSRIDLRNNVNLSQQSKDKLKEKFGDNVKF